MFGIVFLLLLMNGGESHQFENCILQCSRLNSEGSWDHVISCKPQFTITTPDPQDDPPLEDQLHSGEEIERERRDVDDDKVCEKIQSFEDLQNKVEQLDEPLIIKKEIQISTIARPKDCSEWKELKPNAENGVYRIYPEFSENGMDVFCDMISDEGGWIVFQRRFNGSVDFNRTGVEFDDGFGSVYGEHWLGLESLHRLTLEDDWQLRIDLQDFEGFEKCASYSSFKIGSGPDYRLQIGKYEGNAGNALRIHQNQGFSTYDRDKDSIASKSCAECRSGAWWHASCGYSNLNGKYFAEGEVPEPWKGTIWFQWRGANYSLKSTEMKIKRSSRIEE